MALFDGLLLTGLHYGVLALALWAFVDALIRPATAYVAASKLSKPAWAAITGLAAVFAYLSGPLGLFWLVAAVASIVYLVDVRPAVRGLSRGGNNW
ncbi:DUF2516 family protein [Geodermatophilus sp. DSM 44513]|uniref:DUF2516 family protein n=1 Tax=Geodermatophilus sp. DSM 44513 TaxID=1528104 RepID=UPI001283E499|nr:DUF2516 family protein [Geodermatophilus sp. DSM 44513]WNV75053.1 DUF2516 family protein [Geodermatophilus sp. DSM 44513]